MSGRQEGRPALVARVRDRKVFVRRRSQRVGGVAAIVLFLALAVSADGSPRTAEANVRVAPAFGIGSPAPEFVPGRLLVRFRSGLDGGDRAASRSRADVELKRRLPISGLELVKLPPGASVAEVAKSLESRPEIRYAEPDFKYRTALTFPHDEWWSFQWGLYNSLAPPHGIEDADVDAPEAWDYTTGSRSVTVAVADSGVVFGHPDLAPNLLSTGYDFIDMDADPTDPLLPGFFQGHGTETAGVLGAKGGNGIGIAGVNWDVGIQPIRACNGGACSVSAIIQAIGYARDQGVPVFNGSFGAYVYSQGMKDAIDAAPNVLFVFSAGNDSLDSDLVPNYPCAYASPNIICVAASDSFDQLASFSNYGATSVDLAAPGDEIVTTSAFYDTTPITSASGTSFAAPFVSGAAALVLSVSPGDSPADLKTKILAGVDTLASMNGKVASGGRLNLDRILPDPPEASLDSRPRFFSRDRTPTFSFSSNHPGSTFVCGLYRQKPIPTSTVKGQCESPKTYGPLSDGYYRFDMVATDSVGVSSYPEGTGFTIDTVGPVTRISGTPGRRSRKRVAKFRFRALRDVLRDYDLAYFECRLDRAKFRRCGSPVKITVKPGRHTFRVRAIDKLGNRGRPDAFRWKVRSRRVPVRS